jgi:hypothetical protein
MVPTERIPLVLASLLFAAAPFAQAGSISGASLTITSVFDGQPAQQFTLNNITNPTLDGGVFSPWMCGIDSSTNFRVVPGTPNGSHTRNEFDVDFSSSGTCITFQSSDTIDMTLQLSPGFLFNGSFAALTIANDVQVPSANLSGDTLTFQMTNLDQTNGLGGQVQYIFDVTQTPEPGTLALFGLAGVALLVGKRRRLG